MKKLSKKIATIRITDLKISTLIGINDWERTQEQEIMFNIRMEYDASKAISSDSLQQALDYKTLKLKIIDFVQKSHFGLLEKLTQEVLNLIMMDKRILKATVQIDKPNALRFARSVSVEMSNSRSK